MYSFETKIDHRVWTEVQCEQVVQAVYKVLEETGCLIKDKKARELLKQAGCNVDEEKVWIPSTVMESAIKSAPSELVIYDRDGEPAINLAKGQVCYGPPISTVFVKDAATGEKRRGLRADASNAALVCDALPNVAWASAMSGISDGVNGLGDVYEVDALLRNTNKPIMYWASSLKNLEYEMEMFEAAVGSSERMEKKPYTICLICPTSPLIHQGDALEQVLYLAKRNSPIVYISGVSIGCTSPMTLAGSVVVGLADTFVGLLISQLTKKGSPFIASRFGDNFDMSKMSIARSYPELIQANAATADVFRYLKIPFCINLGDTDSGLLDQVATFDISMQAYTGALSGINMIMGLGGSESCNLADYSNTAFGDEAVGFVKNVVHGIEISEDTLGLNSIASVGPGGNFLTEKATLKNLRKFYKPRLLKARTLDEWEGSGKEDLSDIYAEKVRKIIADGTQHPLSDECLARLDEIVNCAEKEVMNSLVQEQL